MSAPLYIQSAEVASIMAAIDEAEGEVTPELEEQLDALYGSMTDKVTALLGYMREERSRADAADDEIKRLRAYRDARKNRVEWAKGYLLRCMTGSGVHELDCGHMGKPKVQAGKPRVDVQDEDALPESMTRVTRSPDKRRIKTALESGLDVPGARLVEGDPFLRID